MEIMQRDRAEKADESKELRLYRKAKRAESLASLREGLVHENKSQLATQTAFENDETIKRSDSAQFRSYQNRVRLGEREEDNERFERQRNKY